MSPIDIKALNAMLEFSSGFLRRKLQDAAITESGHVSFTTLYIRDLADALEAARDALSGQSEPVEFEFDQGPVVPLPTHEEIRKKYQNIPQPPTALERLVFDTTTEDQEQGEALRAVLEGRPSVPVVTPVTNDVRAALVELVNLEDMRLRLKSLHERGHGTDYDNYHCALPIAWEAARRALSAQQDGK